MSDDAEKLISEIKAGGEDESYVTMHGSSDDGDALLESLGANISRRSMNYVPPDELKFAQLVASGSSISDAYKECFNTSGMTVKQIKINSETLLRRRRVSRAVSEMREKLASVAKVDMGELVNLINEAIRMSREQQDAKALLSAVDRLSNLFGIGEHQKRKDGATNMMVINLDEDTRKRMISELVSDDIIDVTPIDVSDAKVDYDG